MLPVRARVYFSSQSRGLGYKEWRKVFNACKSMATERTTSAKVHWLASELRFELMSPALINDFRAPKNSIGEWLAKISESRRIIWEAERVVR